MPWRSIPPDLALGSGALSLKAEPSNFSGTGAATAKEGNSRQAPAATATLLLRNSRRLHHGRTLYGSVMTFLPVGSFLYERHACPSGPCRRRRNSPCGLKPLSQHSPDCESRLSLMHSGRLDRLPCRVGPD